MSTKIFVGNLPLGSSEIVRGLFEQYGVVTECDVLGSYGFVHMANAIEANIAISELNGQEMNGVQIKVELSTAETQGKKKRVRPATKIFVGNIKPGTANEQLREIFEPYGTVTEADVVGGYGFVHMANESQALEAIRDLNGFKLNGSLLTVELSTKESQGKTQREGHVVGERGRGGMMPWGPTRGRGRGVVSSRFDPYSAPPGPSSWLPRPDPYATAEPTYAAEPYRSVPAVLHAPPPRLPPSSEDSSFARELLQLYTQDPAAFDAYARNPQVRRSLNLDPEQPMVATMRVREDPYLKPVREYLSETRVPTTTRMVQPGVMVSSYGRATLAPVPRLPVPGAALHSIRQPPQLYMSFE